MTDEPSSSPLSWRDDGLPASRLYGDVYFSSDDGLAETEAVFLQGCGLPEGWRARGRFVVGELGFGTGLNIAALLDLWRRDRPAGGRLHIFSVEAHPITAQEAARALSRWPRIGAAAQALIEHWPGRAAGFHRVELPAFNAVLDLAVMDVEAALTAWSGMADAWFLDGFSPALNPAMWSDEVLNLVARRSAPGARAATFTVAGQVRRGLSAAGFTVAKLPGYGRKRERLEAYIPTAPLADRGAPHVAIIGGGVSGASAARAVRALGGGVTLLDPRGLGGGASGNPAALVTPRLDAGDGPAARLFAQAVRRAAHLYAEVPGAVVAQGVLQLEAKEKDAGRFERIAASPLFEAGSLTRLDAAATAAALEEADAPGALRMAEALVVEPAVALAAWAGEVVRTEVAALERDEQGWRLLDSVGAEILRADAVVLAAGMGVRTLLPETPLQPVRGQASFTDAVRPAAAAAFGGYVIPTADGGVLFGATHDRDVMDEARRADDDARNLAVLAGRAPRLAQRLAGAPLRSRASIRATTPDRLPSAGPVSDGLYVLTGMGSRGFCAAPLLAEHIAALILDAPSPLPRDLASLLHPGRFAARRTLRS